MKNYISFSKGMAINFKKVIEDTAGVLYTSLLKEMPIDQSFMRSSTRLNPIIKNSKGFEIQVEVNKEYAEKQDTEELYHTKEGDVKQIRYHPKWREARKGRKFKNQDSEYSAALSYLKGEGVLVKRAINFSEKAFYNANRFFSKRIRDLF